MIYDGQVHSSYMDYWYLQARALAELVAAGIQPLQNLSVQFKYSDDAEKRKEWAQFWINRGFTGIQDFGVLIKGTNVQLLTASEGHFEYNIENLGDIYFRKQKYMYFKILGTSLTPSLDSFGSHLEASRAQNVHFCVSEKTLRYRYYNIIVNLTFS